MSILGDQSGLSLSLMLLLGWRRRTTGTLFRMLGEDTGLLEHHQLLIPSFLKFSTAACHTRSGFSNLLEPLPLAAAWKFPRLGSVDSEFVALAEKSVGRVNHSEKPEPFNTTASYFAT